MKQIVWSLALLPLLGVAGQAQEVLFTNFGPGFTYTAVGWFIATTGACAPGGTAQVGAAQFEPPTNAYFSDAKLALYLQSGTPEVSVYLEADAAGMPGTIIEGPLNVTGLSSTAMVFTASSILHPLLLSGTPYWLVVTPTVSPTCAVWNWNSIGERGLEYNITGAPTGPWIDDTFDLTPVFEIDGVAGAGADAYQLRYFSNVTTLGGSLINLSNTGAIDPATATGTICANIYVFDPNEEELECCSCQITPNALQSISVTALLSQNLTPEKPNSTVVKLLATGLIGTTCDPTTAGSGANPLVPGLRAWATTLHQTGGTPNLTYGTETEFSPAGLTLSQGELNRLTNTCAFIKANGSGNGQCSVCATAGGQ